MITHLVAFPFLLYFKNINHNIHIKKYHTDHLFYYFVEICFVLVRIALVMVMMIDNTAIQLSLSQALSRTTLLLPSPYTQRYIF